MKNYFLALLAFGLVTSMTACDKKNSIVDTKYTVAATANGANERPVATTTTGTGALTGTYHKETGVLDYTVTWQNLTDTATGMHFHGPAVTDSSAGVQVAITGFTPGTSGSFSSTATLTSEQATQMLAGLWYYNVHTATYPAGEIRGQISASQQ